MVRRVWSRNSVNEEALAHWGLLSKKKKPLTQCAHSHTQHHKAAYPIGVSFKLFGVELPEDGEQPKHVGAK